MKLTVNELKEKEITYDTILENMGFINNNGKLEIINIKRFNDLRTGKSSYDNKKINIKRKKINNLKNIKYSKNTTNNMNINNENENENENENCKIQVDKNKGKQYIQQRRRIISRQLYFLK
jgi:hypothetical protein